MTGVDGTEIFESSSDQARVPDACSSLANTRAHSRSN